MGSRLEFKDIEQGRSNEYDVNYILYVDKVKGTKIYRNPILTHNGAKNNNRSCFGSLGYQLDDKANPKYNRLIYILKSKKKPSVEHIIPSLDIRKAYVDLCVKYKTLPDCIKLENIKLNKYVIKLDDKNLTPSLLYIYLCSLRMIQECPIFVKDMVNLVHKHNISFYLAWGIASKLGTSNTAHNVAYFGSTGGITPKDISRIFVNIKKCRGLMKYLQNPCKYDTKKICNKTSIRSDSIIANASNNLFDKEVPLDRCKNHNLNLSIDTVNDRVAIQYLKKYEKEMKKWKIKKGISTLTTRK